MRVEIDPSIDFRAITRAVRRPRVKRPHGRAFSRLFTEITVSVPVLEGQFHAERAACPRYRSSGIPSELDRRCCVRSVSVRAGLYTRACPDVTPKAVITRRPFIRANMLHYITKLPRSLVHGK